MHVGAALRLARFGDRSTRVHRDSITVEAVCANHDEIATERFSSLGATPAITSATMADLERRAVSLEREVARRSRLERRLQQLLELTCDLAGASTIAEVAQLAIDKGIAAVGAAGVALWIRKHDVLEAIGMSERVASNRARFETLPLEADMPVSEVVRTGEPIFLRSSDDYWARFPSSCARVASQFPSREIAFAVMPLIANTTTVGAICFTYDHHREFDINDRTFKSIIARQCALALERVQLHEAERSLRQAAEAAASSERAARARSELLYQLTSKVNLIDNMQEVCDLALSTLELGAHCDRSAILFFDGAGVMRFRAHHGLSATYRAAVDGHSPWRADDDDPDPGRRRRIPKLDPGWASYREIFRAEGIRALAFVPLVHHRKVIGKVMLYRNNPGEFTADELQLASTAAVHVALAVERTHAEHELARAFSEERAAHLEAEEATRAREEILSVVSHDLRSPLGTILLGASSLLAVELGDRSQRIRPVAQRIHRQAERMARLIEDLVDFAAIQSGRVVLERSLHRATEILDAATDMFGAMAIERGLRFEARATPDLPPIECDSERAVQVLSNLVSNALKVTPRGGAIAIGAEPKDREVVFFVRDTGPGIDPEDMPNLFERFWRGKESRYRGAGLGLSIARGIVDAHGGRIWAESQVGVGSTFYFSLSALQN